MKEDLSLEKTVFMLFANVLKSLPDSYEKLASVGADRFVRTPEIVTAFNKFSTLTRDGEGNIESRIISAGQELKKSFIRSESLLGESLLQIFLAN